MVIIVIERNRIYFNTVCVVVYAVQYNLVEYSVGHSSTVQYSTIQYNTVQNAIIQHNTVRQMRTHRYSSRTDLCESRAMREIKAFAQPSIRSQVIPYSAVFENRSISNNLSAALGSNQGIWITNMI
jgi:hypothetical protein